jgi:hypothetical protein
LDRELQRQGRRKAQALGISFSEYMRRLLQRDLAEVAPDTSPSLVFDLGHSGDADIARKKDMMVGEAIGKDRKRPRK